MPMKTSNLAQVYQQRVKYFRDAMRTENLAALLVYGGRRGHVRYLSGYHPNYSANLGMVILPRIGNPSLIIRFPFDLERAQRESWITDIEASGSVEELALKAIRALRQNNLTKGRLGLVTGDSVINEMSYDVYNILKTALSDAHLVDAGDLFNEARLTKSNIEFENLRRSAKVADRGAKAVYEILKPGKNECEIVAAVESRMRVLGAEMYLVSTTSRGISESIGPPKSRVLKLGDTLLMAIAVQISGYTTQVARTFIVGAANEEHRSIYRAVFDAYMAGVSATKIGNTCSDIAVAIDMAVKSHGYEPNFDHDMGHGIGIDLPEAPKIDFKDKTVIRPGFVLVVHPSIRVPSVGSAFLGGTILVHPEGVETIHQIPVSID
jgi:Xaa-Pro dipeptidase